jgi:DNA-binding winged helix-turn-helix (wHTH) protein/TolB-like protein
MKVPGTHPRQSRRADDGLGGSDSRSCAHRFPSSVRHRKKVNSPSQSLVFLLNTPEDFPGLLDWFGKRRMISAEFVADFAAGSIRMMVCGTYCGMVPGAEACNHPILLVPNTDRTAPLSGAGGICHLLAFVYATMMDLKMNLQRFRFGLFEFDAATRELRRERVLVRLQSQPAQVLSYLLEHAGKVVLREELHRTVWGNETFVDFERGLNFCIAQIRSALDDDSVAPRYVRTVPRRGYQFIAPVEGISERPEQTEERSPTRKFPARPATLVCAIAILVSLALSAGYARRFRHDANRSPIVAVLRFDNETTDAGGARLSDELTDSVVFQLTSTSHGQYDVIGNARILRLPRDQRDLRAIWSSLHARYVVLGQVQNHGNETRVLAHLIRLPEQTHLWVVRLDRSIGHPLDMESEVAEKIATEFSQKVTTDSTEAASPPGAKH